MSIARPLASWFKPLFERFLAFGVQNVAREEAARFGADVIRSQREMGDVASEALDVAQSLGRDGNRYQQEVSALLSEGIVETVRIYNQVSSLQMSEREGQEALAENPFSRTSERSERDSLPSNGTKALEEPNPPETNGEQPPIRRGRGRPPGAKNRPKTDG